MKKRKKSLLSDFTSSKNIPSRVGKSNDNMERDINYIIADAFFNKIIETIYYQAILSSTVIKIMTIKTILNRVAFKMISLAFIATATRKREERTF